MNKGFAEAIGIKFHKNGWRGGNKLASEVKVTCNNESRTVRISFRGDKASRLGDYVLVSQPHNGRVYICPCSKQEDGAYKVCKTAGSSRGSVQITLDPTKADSFNQYAGTHKLIYWSDLDGYYFRETEKEEKQ